METELIDDGSELMTGEAVALDLRPTGFVLRAAGSIIDFIVYLGVWLLLVLGLNSPALSPLFDDASAAAATIAALVFSILIVPMAVETATQGKSLGRLAVGARIVRDDGGAISLRHAFVRALMGTVEIFGTFGGIAVLTALFNSRSKRLGDLLAGTYSQNERVSRAVAFTWTMPPMLEQWALTADVARMPDGLSRRTVQFLQQAGGLTPHARQHLAAELASETSRWVSPVPAGSAEAFLVAATLVRRRREAAALGLQADLLHNLDAALEGMPHGFPTRLEDAAQ